MLVTAKDGVDVSNARTTSSSVIGVVSYGEEPDARFQVSVSGNLTVEVVDYGDRQGGGAGFDPVFAELVAVAGMDRLNRVSDGVKEPVEGVEGPAGAAKGFPYGGIVGEGAEGDKGIVGGASAENFGAGVADV